MIRRTTAIIWGYRNDNPARCIKPIRQERQLPYPLSKEEFGEMLLATEDQQSRASTNSQF